MSSSIGDSSMRKAIEYRLKGVVLLGALRGPVQGEMQVHSVPAGSKAVYSEGGGLGILSVHCVRAQRDSLSAIADSAVGEGTGIRERHVSLD